MVTLHYDRAVGKADHLHIAPETRGLMLIRYGHEQKPPMPHTKTSGSISESRPPTHLALHARVRRPLIPELRGGGPVHHLTENDRKSG
jgi:hypothetical protein